MGDRPQAIINQQVLKNSDLLIAIFWTRLGTPTGEAPSGTVEEIDEHLKRGKPVMLYFSSAPVRTESVDADQYRALQEFRQECERRGLVESYDDLNDFRWKFARQLATTINIHEHFKVSGNPASDFGSRFDNRASIPELSKEAVELLVEASRDPQGRILNVRHKSGMDVLTNKRSFVEQGNSQSRAVWTGAIDDLAEKRLIKDLGHEGQIYEVTPRGYDLAKLLSR